jgi:hypothetical protein
VIGVGDQDLDAGPLQVGGREHLDSGPGSHRDEGRRFDGPVRGVQQAGAGPAVLGGYLEDGIVSWGKSTRYLPAGDFYNGAGIVLSIGRNARFFSYPVKSLLEYWAFK